MTHPRHIVCSCVLVRDEAGRVLLVRTPRRGWELPGGQVELGEPLSAAAIREVEEESGIVIADLRLLGLYSCITPPEMLVILFAARSAGGQVRTSDETTDVRWMSAADARTHVTHPPALMRLRDALRDPHLPLLRAYERSPFRIID